MIHQQDNGLTYAYCACGVCGPLRRLFETARRDEKAHAEVCSTRGKATA